jgi:hypothetical protein
MLDKLCNIPISMPIPIGSSILSFTNSLICILFMYKYNETKDVSWFINLSYFFLTYLLIDLFLNIYMLCVSSNKFDTQKCKENIFHHIITGILITWGITFRFGIEIIPETIYKIILFETSTIFLNFRIWIKEYLKVNNENNEQLLYNFVKKIQPFNDVIFAALFLYNRCYIGIKDILFNTEFYNKMLSNEGLDPLLCVSSMRNGVNRFIIFILIIFLILNMYWGGIIFKGFYKLFTRLQRKDQNQPEDKEFLLIEKISSQLQANRDDINKNI